LKSNCLFQISMIIQSLFWWNVTIQNLIPSSFPSMTWSS
jgi:hypothetical protein